MDSTLTLLRKIPFLNRLVFRIDQLEAKCRQLETQLAECDCLPVPPVTLRVRVGGWEEVDHFLGVGRKISWDVKKLLKGVNRPFESFPAVLDFGCGCARVLRFMRPSPGQMIMGTDIDKESIAWCQEYLGTIAQFQINHDFPPLPLPEKSVDLIYSVSVFTHLPEEMQFQWLAELRRVLKPGGILVTSVHGESLFPIAEEVNKFQETGFYYLKGDSTPGLPDYYQATFHTQTYVQREWSRFFKILKIQTRAINNHQDGVVCERVEE